MHGEDNPDFPDFLDGDVAELPSIHSENDEEERLHLGRPYGDPEMDESPPELACALGHVVGVVSFAEFADSLRSGAHFEETPLPDGDEPQSDSNEEREDASDDRDEPEPESEPDLAHLWLTSRRTSALQFRHS